MMKAIFFLFVCLATNPFCFAADGKKINCVIDSTDTQQNYLGLAFTKGGKSLKYFNCIKSNGKTLFEIKYSDTLIIKKELEQPNVFEIINEHLNDLKLAAKNQVKYRGAKSFLKQYNDTSQTTLQIFIRYKDLHFNHFQLLTVDELSKIKNKKIANGFQVIKRLFTILTLAENQKN